MMSPHHPDSTLFKFIYYYTDNNKFIYSPLTWPSCPICMVHIFVIFTIFQFYLPVSASLYTTPCHNLYHILGVLNKLISDCKNAHPLLLSWYFHYCTDNNQFIYTPLTWPSVPLCMVNVFLIFSKFQFYLPVAAGLYTTPYCNLYHILDVLNKSILIAKIPTSTIPFCFIHTLLYW